MNNRPDPPDPLPLPAEVLSRLLFCQAFDPVLIVNAETGLLVEGNPAAERMFGYPREELIGMAHARLLPQGPALDEVSGAGDGQPDAPAPFVEVSFAAASGEVRSALVSACGFEGCGARLVMEVFREIPGPEGPVAETPGGLREDQAKLAIALTLTNSALWEGNFSRDEFTFNDQFYSLYGTTAEAEGGYVLPTAVYGREFIHPDDAQMLSEEVEAAVNSSQLEVHRTLEHRIVRRDGETRHIAVRYMLYRDSRTGQLRSIGANQDITEIKVAQEKLLAAKRAADVANQAKSDFLANMSHEIRTPLNGVMSMLQLIQLQARDETGRELAGEAVTSCTRLSRLLGDILDLSRIEAGRLVLDSKPFALQGVMKSVNTLFGPSASQAGLVLNFVVDDDIPPLAGDEYRLQQVLNNLVGNAIKCTDAGEITVAACRLAAKQPGICRLLFKVSDTGIGIEDDMQRSLFNPFVQAGDDLDRKHSGTGLGLSISKSLIDLMGGTLSFASEQGVGTTILFSIPFEVATGPVEAGPEDFSLGQAAPLGLAVLVVEDDRVSRLALTRALEAFGCDVATAEDGEAALETLAAGSYDVVFMDRQLPRMDGVEATKAIRRGDAGSANRRVHVVALTAATMKDEKESFLKAEVDGYLSKPVDFRLLYGVLQRFVAGR